MRGRSARFTLALVLAALASCGHGAPFTPKSTYALSGHVTLRGYYMDRDGNFTGTRVIGDAEGVPLELHFGDAVIARTTTHGGIYRFPAVRPGQYFVSTRIVPGIEWQTHPVTVVNSDLAVADTLRLSSLGDILPVPNPFTDSVTVSFVVHDSTEATKLALVDIGGQPVRTFFDHPVPINTYTASMKLPLLPANSAPRLWWITFTSGPDLRAQLLVQEAAAAPILQRSRARRSLAVR